MEIAIERLFDLPGEALVPLLAESERSGLRFIRRLADEWAAGTNRFDHPGEALFAAVAGGAVVGVCGLNADPYSTDPDVGRVRRLYVLKAYRDRGAARRLLQAVVEAARGRFVVLRVRTENVAAGGLYERIGFVKVVGGSDCTHTLALGTVA